MSEVTAGTLMLTKGCFPPGFSLVAKVAGNTCSIGRSLPTVS